MGNLWYDQPLELMISSHKLWPWGDLRLHLNQRASACERPVSYSKMLSLVGPGGFIMFYQPSKVEESWTIRMFHEFRWRLASHEMLEDVWICLNHLQHLASTPSNSNKKTASSCSKPSLTQVFTELLDFMGQPLRLWSWRIPMARYGQDGRVSWGSHRWTSGSKNTLS